MSGAVRSIRYSNCLEEISLKSLFDILVCCFVRVRTDDTRIWGKFTKSCSQNKNLPSIFTVYFYRFVQVHFCPLDSGQYFWYVEKINLQSKTIMKIHQTCSWKYLDQSKTTHHSNNIDHKFITSQSTSNSKWNCYCVPPLILLTKLL